MYLEECCSRWRAPAGHPPCSANSILRDRRAGPCWVLLTESLSLSCSKNGRPNQLSSPSSAPFLLECCSPGWFRSPPTFSSGAGERELNCRRFLCALRSEPGGQCSASL